MKWLFLITFRNVDFDGLKRAAWRYCTSTFVCCLIGVIRLILCCWGIFGSGISQSPSSLFHMPLRMSSKFLKMCKYFLSSRMIQPSSASQPRDKSEWLVNPGMMYALLALVDRVGMFRDASPVEVSMSEFGKVTLTFALDGCCCKCLESSLDK